MMRLSQKAYLRAFTHFGPKTQVLNSWCFVASNCSRNRCMFFFWCSLRKFPTSVWSPLIETVIKVIFTKFGIIFSKTHLGGPFSKSAQIGAHNELHLSNFPICKREITPLCIRSCKKTSLIFEGLSCFRVKLPVFSFWSFMTFYDQFTDVVFHPETLLTSYQQYRLNSSKTDWG